MATNGAFRFFRKVRSFNTKKIFVGVGICRFPFYFTSMTRQSCPGYGCFGLTASSFSTRILNFKTHPPSYCIFFNIFASKTYNTFYNVMSSVLSQKSAHSRSTCVRVLYTRFRQHLSALYSNGSFLFHSHL